MKKSFLFLMLFLLGAVGVSYGAGFALYEWSARGNALGGTLVDRADDASAVAFNPAGMTQLEGTHFMAGVTAIAPDMKVDIEGNGATNENNNIFFPPHFYLTHQINDRYWIGVGEYTRFGLATDFPSDWAGRYNSYYASIVSYSIVPSVAVKLTDKLSFAVGLEAMYFEFQQKKIYLSSRTYW